ncbi:alpha/beta fold hydrolase [Actinomadura sp. DC4]|uniref:alpha/beta fold hydrolase n=1 Tax=Actinomadura sp. DC4 TaxID=3055069 RepID=UPI0025AEF56E|nr:alpha/beta fold hydrolase [Actinomadura sp. DC4]MDN3351215.1 alpha/beta fold hydrolase [Actinomadura sp. DC4]
MSERSVETAYGRFAVRTHGSGEPVVLLHPLALSGALWRPLADALGEDFEVFSLDLRGHGESGWDGRPFSIEDMARDVAAVLDALELPSAGLLGMSMGGSVAVTFAGLFPERARSLILADTTAWYGENAATAWAERARRAAEVPRAEQLPFQIDRWFSPAFPDREPAEVDRVTQIFLRTDSRAHAAASLAMGRLDARPLLSAVRAPALVIVGEDDYATPPAMAGGLAEGIPGATLLSLPGLRHLSLVERPELADVVRRVFAGDPVAGDPR